ncbi:MAG TPA: hypothetical protein VMB52_06845 [Verrucomicrobiae bacterium]|nr:hypothetical protein [Verrucomicrobiae bacterium]
MSESAPDETSIMAEFDAGVEEMGFNRYLNNFPLNLPGGMVRSFLEDELNGLDRPLVGSYPSSGGNEDLHSEKARTVTWREFFADVDSALGIDPADLQRLQRSVEMSIFAGEEHDALYRILESAYLRLRLLGYSHYDLTR